MFSFSSVLIKVGIDEDDDILRVESKDFTAVDFANMFGVTKRMSATVPAGTREGETFHINVPGRGMMALVVPVKSGPGKVIQFKLNPLQGG